MGIQDFDFQVQQAINRIQSFVLVEKLVTQIRALGFESLNFDLIYGLPKQTKDTVRETIQKVSILKPDLIALYSYAHLPRVLKNQRLIKNEDLPSPENKRELYELAKTLLEQEGYIEIGLDHFCLPDSYLGKAYRSNGLKRNFMGYTDKKSNCLVGLGVSAISSTPEMYVQNKKDVQTYYESLKKEEFDFHTGHVLTPEDKIVDMIIQNIMCTRMTDLNQLKDFIYFKEIENKLHEMQNDGLLEYQNDFFEVTEEGNAFLRNIAHVFDRYAHKNEEKKFSQTI